MQTQSALSHFIRSDRPQTNRPQTLRLENGTKAMQPFPVAEYEARLSTLRRWMDHADVQAVLLTSMHNIAYYSGFLYCSFGRPYACVVTDQDCTTVSANIDCGQPWRNSVGDNVVYTDWERDNYWRAIRDLTSDRMPSRTKSSDTTSSDTTSSDTKSSDTKSSGSVRIGIESDVMTLNAHKALNQYLGYPETVDISDATMRQRMVKSALEIELITSAAAIADVGGEAIRSAIRPGQREIDIAMAGRNAMELEIAARFPDSEIRDSWVWFQSGINTDGAHNPVTTRVVEAGDILSLNTFPMISGYYVALERTLFLGEPDIDSRRIWEANVAAHDLGKSLIKPGMSCSSICAEINAHFESLGLLDYRTFGYGHSFGILSHYYGREAGLEIREDIETVLEPGMVISMEPMLTVPLGQPGAGGYREHDILVVTESGAENVTGFPYGPAHNII